MRVSNAKSYLSCYYHISAYTNIWKAGSKINIKLNSANNVAVYMYGGNSKTNASIAVLAANLSLTVG